MKKVLMVSPFFFPELISTGKYNTELALQLAKQNIEIDILCSHPLYPDWKPKKADKNLQGIKAKRGGGWLRYPSHPLLRRLVLELWFFFYTLINVRKLRASDAVIVVFPPSFFVLVSFIVSSKTKVIGIVHDLQAVHLKAGASTLKRLMLGMIKIVERVAFKRCDSLIYLSSEMKREATHQYGLQKINSHIAYPFITLEKFTDNENLKTLFAGNFFNIVYSGALGEKQNPQGIFKLASALTNKYSNVKFLIFSSGPYFEKLKKHNENERIVFADLVHTDDLGELLLKSDVQLVPQAADTSKGSLPSKLPNILASGSMVFAITDKDSELQELLEQQQGCVVSHTWDTQQNVKLMDDLITQPSVKFNRQDKLSLYKRDYLAKLIEQII